MSERFVPVSAVDTDGGRMRRVLVDANALSCPPVSLASDNRYAVISVFGHGPLIILSSDLAKLIS